MKKILLGGMLSLVAAIAVNAFGATLNVPGEYATIADAVAVARNGDEIVLAKSEVPYILSAKLALSDGVTVRGATHDFGDVVVSGGMKIDGAFSLGTGCSVSNITFCQYYPGPVFSSASSSCKVENCRFTAVTNDAPWSGTVLSFSGAFSRIVVDNCRVGSGYGASLLECRSNSAIADRFVVTNNFFEVSGNADAGSYILNVREGGKAKNSFIGYNTIGLVRSVQLTKGIAYGPVVNVDGSVENCVVIGNVITGYASGLGAVDCLRGSIVNSVILGNGFGTDNWTKVNGANYSHCISTDTDTMTSSFESFGSDIVSRPGALPWIPYGSKAVGSGEDGADIGRIWLPETLQCAVQQDKRNYIGAATVNLLALASKDAIFAWEHVSGTATLVAEGKAATLVFDEPGTAVVRVTATSAGETATDEITIVSTPATYDVSTAAELEAAVDAAEDGAEIVIAAGDYVTTKTLTLKNAVTLRGATGNRGDVTISGNNNHCVFTVDHPNAVVSSLTVRNGRSSSFGAGGVLMEAGGMLTNVAVYGCVGPAWWGAYNSREWHLNIGNAVANYNGKLINCDISANKQEGNINNNSAYGQHGSLALADTLVVTNNISTAAASSGTYYSAPIVLTGGGIIRNAFVAYNDIGQPTSGTGAQDANGVYVQEGRLENSTIFRNRVHENFLGYAAGVYLEANGVAVNCLIAENGDKNGNVDNCRLATGATVNNCALTPIPDSASDCVDYSGDPSMLYSVDARGYPVPRTGSPTVDAGDNALEWIATGLDFYGKPRLLNGIVDIGAFEYEPVDSPISAELIVKDTSGSAPFTTTIACAVEGSRLTGLSYTWTYERVVGAERTTGVQVTEEPFCVFAGLPVGHYTFSVMVRNDNEPPDCATATSAEGALAITPSVCFVSPIGSNTWPYETIATAATNISDAIAVAHDKVVVLPGDYSAHPHVTDADGVDFAVIVDRPIWIAGAPGAAFDCGGRGGFKLSAEGARISDLVITNFATAVQAGVLYVSGGVVSNVVVDGCRAKSKMNTKLSVFTDSEVVDSRFCGIRVVDDWDCKPPVTVVGKSILLRTNLSDIDTRYGSLLSANRVSYDRPQIVACQFSGNAVGGSVLSLNHVDLADCRIIDNFMYAGGFVVDDVESEVVLMRCALVGNDCAQSGVLRSGAWASKATELINCLVANNVASSSAAVLMPNTANGFIRLVNTTVANNDGPGIVVSGAYSPRLAMKNSIVYGNTTDGVPRDVSGDPAGMTIDHSCYSEAVAEEGDNISEDPVFRNRGKMPFALRPTSPCRGIGDATVWTMSATDIRGERRLVDGKVDLGCYEMNPLGFALFLK